MARTAPLSSISLCEVTVVEDDGETVYSKARLDVLASTVKLYSYEPTNFEKDGSVNEEHPGYRWVDVDVLRHAQRRAGTKSKFEISGESDQYRGQGIDPAGSVITWKVSVAKGADIAQPVSAA